ncbi:MAG: hypothetical protein ABFS03_00050 [Chloroflexota bacterium]
MADEKQEFEEMLQSAATKLPEMRVENRVGLQSMIWLYQLQHQQKWLKVRSSPKDQNHRWHLVRQRQELGVPNIAAEGQVEDIGDLEI